MLEFSFDNLDREINFIAESNANHYQDSEIVSPIMCGHGRFWQFLAIFDLEMFLNHFKLIFHQKPRLSAF